MKLQWVWAYFSASRVTASEQATYALILSWPLLGSGIALYLPPPPPHSHADGGFLYGFLQTFSTASWTQSPPLPLGGSSSKAVVFIRPSPGLHGKEGGMRTHEVPNLAQDDHHLYPPPNCQAMGWSGPQRGSWRSKSGPTLFPSSRPGHPVSPQHLLQLIYIRLVLICVE